MDAPSGGASPEPNLSRRAFLRRSSGVALAIPIAAVFGDVAAAQPLPYDALTVRPREEWAQGLPPVGPVVQEQPGDVRLLLVHHTASSNDYGPGDVPALIRGFYSFHTGATKNWSDVAYNFFVDRYGVAWEGRAGSLAGPVQPDATGGSQGFAQLCCFIGDHSVKAPTEQARQTMIALLAALAERYGIATGQGATTTFVSRGSSRWPAGAAVTSPTIAGHRDMSQTSCPGEAAYALVRATFPAEVAALRASRSTAAVPEETTATPPVPNPSGSPDAAPTTPPTALTDETAERESFPIAATVVAGGAVTAGTAVGLYVRGRRRRLPLGPDTEPSRDSAPNGH